IFVSERHRSDMADVLHLILCRGDQIDWKRLLHRIHAHWRLFLAQIHIFDYVYPGHRNRIPDWVRRELLERAREDDATGDPEVCAGTLISRFSFSIDVNEWGFRDLRQEATRAAGTLRVIRGVMASDVWKAGSWAHGQGLPSRSVARGDGCAWPPSATCTSAGRAPVRCASGSPRRTARRTCSHCSV